MNRKYPNSVRRAPVEDRCILSLIHVLCNSFPCRSVQNSIVSVTGEKRWHPHSLRPVRHPQYRPQWVPGSSSTFGHESRRWIKGQSSSIDPLSRRLRLLSRHPVLCCRSRRSLPESTPLYSHTCQDARPSSLRSRHHRLRYRRRRPPPALCRSRLFRRVQHWSHSMLRKHHRSMPLLLLYGSCSHAKSYQAESPSGNAILALIGMPLEETTGLIGFNCNPISSGGITDPSCAQSAVCCTNNNVVSHS